MSLSIEFSATKKATALLKPSIASIVSKPSEISLMLPLLKRMIGCPLRLQLACSHCTIPISAETHSMNVLTSPIPPSDSIPYSALTSTPHNILTAGPQYPLSQSSLIPRHVHYRPPRSTHGSLARRICHATSSFLTVSLVPQRLSLQRLDAALTVQLSGSPSHSASLRLAVAFLALATPCRSDRSTLGTLPHAMPAARSIR